MPGAVKDSKDGGLCFVKREFELRSGISPYICSTWHDLQVEHTSLTTQVFPPLQSVCRQRGVYFDPIHLLYEEGNEFVASGDYLTSCLHFIRRCAPFFLCLVGERYGCYRDGEGCWGRNLDLAETGGYGWVSEDESCSDLEIQVTEAAFNQNSDHCHFYYRKPEFTESLQQGSADVHHPVLRPETPDTDLKLRTLKQRIINKGHRVRYYGNTQELCTLVSGDWKALIDLLCPPLCQSLNITSQRDEQIYKSWLSHEHYADIRRQHFLSLQQHDRVLSELTEFALTALDDPPEDWDGSITPAKIKVSQRNISQVKDTRPEYPPALYQSVLTLVGDRGSGKTSLLARWMQEFMEECPFVRVFSHYVGVNDHSLGGVNTLKRCMSHLSNELHNNLEYLSETCGVDQTLASLGQVFTAAVAHQPCVIVLDGVDDLGKSTISPSQQVRELSWLLYPLPPHVRVIVSTCRSDTSYQRLSCRPDTRVLEMPGLSSTEEKMELLSEHLRVPCQNILTPRQLEMISRSRQLERPLFVQLLASELRQPQVLREVDKYLQQYLETCSVRELVGKMVRRWVEKYSWNINKNAVQGQGFKKQTDTVRDTSGWVAETLRLIAVSRDGLTRAELLLLLEQIGYNRNSGVSESDWLMFCDVLIESFLYQTPEGVLRFRHLHVREAVEHALLSPDSPQQATDYSVKVVIPKKKLDPSKERRQIERVVYRRHLARFFSSQPHSHRKLHELVWQLSGSRDYVKLKQAVSEPSLFMALYTHPDTRSELLCLWAILQVAGYDPSQTYTHMLSLAAHINDVPEIQISGEDRPQMSEEVVDCKEELEGDTSEDIHKSGVQLLDLDLLQLCAGQMLGDLTHYDTGLMILSDLHTSLTQRTPLCPASEMILCRAEASLASQLLQMDMLADSSRLYERALSRVSDLLLTLMSDAQEAQLISLKGRLLTSLGSLYIMQMKTKEAELALRNANHCMKTSNCSMGAAQVLFNKGVLRLEQHEFSKADQCFEQAVRAYRKWFGDRHHKVADVLHEYAGMLCDARNTHRYEKQAARQMYSEALELRLQHYGNSHLIVAETLCHYGQLLKSLSDPSCRSEALSMLRRALDIRSTQLGPTHPLTKQAYSLLNDLEVSIQYHSLPHFYSDRRPGNTLYTTLSWHEAELLQFQLRKSRRLAQKRNSKLAIAVKAIGMLKAIRVAKKDVSSNNQEAIKVQDSHLQSNVTWTISDTNAPTESQVTASVYESEGTEIRDEEESVNQSEEVELRLTQDEEAGADSSPCIEDNGKHEHVEQGAEEMSFNQSEELNVTKVTPHRGRDSPQHVSARPVSRVDIRPRQDAQSLDNYSEDTSDRRILRPQSAPYRMLERYRSSGLSAHSSQVSVVRHAKRQVTSAPTHGASSPHHRTCQPPLPHAIHPANTRSVINGPHTSTQSLLSTQTPHPVGIRLHHTSAWYHVPGRYPTQHNPPKRSQKRDAHRKLLKCIHTRNTDRLLSSTLPHQIEMRARRY